MPLHPNDLSVDAIYSRTELLARGMHSRHVASEAMRRVFPGWWARAESEMGLPELAALFQTQVRPGAVLSHETSAEIFGFPLPWKLTYAGGAPIRCRGPEGTARTAGGLVVTHLPTSDPTFEHQGLTMSHPLIALRDIAPRLTHVELVVCLDALAADRFGTAQRMRRATIERSVSVLQGRGAPALRRALPHVRERSWSPMETKLRLQIVAHGFPEPALNIAVVEPTTPRRFYIDLAYEEEKIAIEYDSETHRQDAQTWQADLHKNDALHDAGWKVLRVSIADYRRPTDFFARLADALLRRRPQAV